MRTCAAHANFAQKGALPVIPVNGPCAPCFVEGVACFLFFNCCHGLVVFTVKDKMSADNQKHGTNPKSPDQSPSSSVSGSPMDKTLLRLFAKFKLDGFGDMISAALGVEAPSDFSDVNEENILETAEQLNLKPVQRNRLLSLHRFVLENNNADICDDVQSRLFNPSCSEATQARIYNLSRTRS